MTQVSFACVNIEPLPARMGLLRAARELAYNTPGRAMALTERGCASASFGCRGGSLAAGHGLAHRWIWEQVMP